METNETNGKLYFMSELTEGGAIVQPWRGIAGSLVVVQFAVTALYERRKRLRSKVRRSQTGATTAELNH